MVDEGGAALGLVSVQVPTLILVVLADFANVLVVVNHDAFIVFHVVIHLRRLSVDYRNDQCCI